MAIPEKMIELFLEKWYPGEWPDNLGLPGGTEADEAFKVKARKECREGLEAAGVAELIEALKAAEHALVTMQGLRATDLTEEQISEKYLAGVDRENLEWVIDDAKTLSRISSALAKATGSPLDDARAAYRASVEAGGPS
jgi:hypothetical protein